MPILSQKLTSLVELARFRALEAPDAIVYTYLLDGEDEEWNLTAGELDRKARATAAMMIARGAKPGDRALLLYPPGLDFIVGFFGCLYANVIAVPAYPPDPMNLERTLPRLQGIVKDCDVKKVLTTGPLFQMAGLLTPLAPEIVELDWLATDGLEPGLADAWRDPSVNPQDLAFLQYTSGSTGTPKGVMVSHGNLLHNEQMIAEIFDAPDVKYTVVSWLPLYHDMGLIGGVLQPLYRGERCVLISPLDFLQRPFRWLQAISKYRGVASTGPNFAYDLVVRKSTPEMRETLDLSCWIRALNGAEPVRWETMQRFAEAMAPANFRMEQFYPCYGLAEATLVVTGKAAPMPVVIHVDSAALERGVAHRYDAPRPGTATLVSSGHTTTDARLRIVDPETARSLPEGRVGEIWAASESIAQGYWKNEAASTETFKAMTAEGEGPFLRTGDLGFLLDGELYVTGRIKDLIIIRGRNHYPQDVERTVDFSHAALRKGCCAAFAVEQDGEEQLTIVVEVSGRFPVGDEEGISEVARAVRQAVSQAHDLRIHDIVFIKSRSILKTSSGKIRRRATKQLYLSNDLKVVASSKSAVARKAPEVRAPAPRPRLRVTGAALALQGWLQDRVGGRLGLSRDQVDPREPFTAYDLDSREAVEISGELEEMLGRRISPTLLYEHPTIEALAAHLGADGVVGPDTGEAVERWAQPIAIVGLGCRFPGAPDPDAYWSLLEGGVDAISEVPADRWDIDALYDPDPQAPGKMSTRWGGFIDQVDQFDPRFFNTSPREARRMDPQQRLMMEVAWEALQDAGLPPRALAGSRTGVFVGIASHDYADLQASRPAMADAYVGTGSALSIAANRLSYFLDLRGPSMAVDTACSSSLVALHLACNSLRTGECHQAIVGGVNLLLSPTVTVSFSKTGFMAPDGRCKAFDARADGYVRGEGAGAVVLKPLAQAQADGDRIYAVIRGTAVNQDGRTNGLIAPSPQSQEAVLREACQRAGVAPAQVQYIEAHGTGTALGDPIEAKALGAVLGEGRPEDRPCLLGSVKTNIGHLEAAAGMAGLIKVALSLKNGRLPPSLHFDSPNPLIPFEELPLQVATALQDWPEGPHIAGVSSFGFGGTNAHAVLGAPPDGEREVEAASAEAPAPPRERLLPISAPSREALEPLVGAWRARLQSPGAALADLAYTAATRAGAFDHRVAVVAHDAGGADALLAAWQQDQSPAGLASGRQSGQARHVVFVFPGQGAQWEGMARDLLDEPVFRDTIGACEAAFAPHVDWSLTAQLRPNGCGTLLDRIDVVQPTLFAVQVALARQWQAWGVEPDAVVGHSMGEVAAAVISGALSLEDGARVICRRSRLMRRVSGRGGMALVELSMADAREALRGLEDKLSIAVSNSPQSTVISGDEATLVNLLTALEQREVFCRRINVDVASHSPQMDVAAEDLRHALDLIRPHAATVPLYSSVTAARAEGETLGPDYWARNLRQPVRFVDTVGALARDGHDVFLEISPHPLLAGAIPRCLEAAGASGEVLPSMRRDEPARSVMLETLGQAWCLGVPVTLERLFPEGGRLTRLPTVPYARERLWFDPGPDAPQGGHPLLGPHQRLSGPGGGHLFESALSLSTAPWLGDHRVRGAVIFPAAGVIELALAAAREALGEGVELRHLAFEQALLLPDEGARTIQLRLGEGAPTRFSLYSQGAGEDAWTRHASGQVHVRKADEPGIIDMAARAAACPEAVDPRDHRDAMAARGLEYGPAFQGLTALQRADGQAVARVEAPAGVFVADFVAHPALLDAAFHALGAALDPELEGTWIPGAVGAVRAYGPLKGALQVHARVDGLLGDVRVTDAEGRVRVEVLGLTLVKLEAAAPDPLRALFFEPAWRSVQASTEACAPGSWLIVGDGARAWALHEALTAAGAACAHGSATDADGLATLLASAERPLTDVVLLPSAAGAPVDAAIHATTLIQAVMKGEDRPRAWLLTEGAVAATPGEVPDPAAATLWGLWRSLGLEHPELRATAIDAAGVEAAALVDTLLRVDAERELALRPDGLRARRLVRASAGQPPLEVPRPAGERPFRVRARQMGSLEDLELRAVTRRAPGPGEVEIRVRAAALNFLDVLTALGMRPDLPAGAAPALGLECAGEVVALGEGVEGLSVGQAVVAFAPESLSAFVTTPATLVAPKPATLGFAEAAAVPAVFMTAHYALNHLGRMARGETVLVHSGAGGVGQAAVQLAARAGVRVLATAGSEAKRAHLREQGVEKVMDSRSLDFVDEVRAHTNGRGVDLVLNALAGEPLRQSVGLLADYGRFLEIGKRDIYDDAPLGLAPFRRNLSFHAIDLARMAADRPERVGALLREVLSLFEAGALEAPPVRVFPATEHRAAFEHLARAEHIGKVVVALDTPEAAIQPLAEARFDGRTTALITGGLGALGLACARWMVGQGARHLALLGRSAPSERAQTAIAALQEAGAQVKVLSGDVSDEASLRAALDTLRAELPPLGTVLHAAGVLDDGVLVLQDAARFRRVFAPKVDGAVLLDRLTADDPVERFVLFSSAASLLGSPGQANYAAANAFLDALAQARRARGLPALSLNWGTWGEIGLAATDTRGGRLEARGLAAMPPDQALAALARALCGAPAQLGVLPLDMEAWARTMPEAAELPLLAELAAEVGLDEAPEAGGGALRARLEALPAEQRHAALVEELTGLIARVLRTASPPDPREPIRDLGLDSLMAVELKGRVRALLGVEVPLMGLLQGMSVDGLADRLLIELSGDAPAPTEAPPAPAEGGWFVTPEPRPQARTRLFCFPCAGGSAGFFGPWAASLPDSVELVSVQLPGREGRQGEPALRTLDAVVDQLAPALEGALDKPFAFLGHSMGSLVAWAVALRLRERGAPLPQRLFLCATVAPQHLARVVDFAGQGDVHDLPKERLLEMMRLLNPPLSLLLRGDAGLWASMEAAVRGDFSILGTFQPPEAAPLDVPITAFYGADDGFAPGPRVADWSTRTTGRVTVYRRPGGHFFLEKDRETIAQEIARQLSPRPGEPLPPPTVALAEPVAVREGVAPPPSSGRSSRVEGRRES
ncbi:MAG: SDR family NAD(P)-dependent oxidoreductase [Alphaproteobacteria bacterium]|nr:SDR family NAD(P)-dependent oxidoreductase [Alphaproteobacteria bacterium]